MEKSKTRVRGFGLIRNFGWKKNLLAVGTGFLVCLLLELINLLISRFRVASQFDLSIAVIPIVGFLLGIWGILGCLLETLAYSFVFFLEAGYPQLMLDPLFLISTVTSLIIYAVLPCFLWYAIKLPGEDKPDYPRMDTSAHVIKYYLIMVVTVVAYASVLVFRMDEGLSKETFLEWGYYISQYLDAALIGGIPVTILVSVIRNRTITINERMVLAFLIVGIIASALGAYLLYRNTLYLDPELFAMYDTLADPELPGWKEEYEEALIRYLNYWKQYYVMIAVMLNSLLVIEMLFMRSIEKKVTKPILHLTDVLGSYTGLEEEGELNPEVVKLECKPYRYGYGEVSTLTRTAVNMVSEIENYTANLQSVTAEKERIGTELDIASKIQRDMLPGVFPPFPDRTEIDLFASMTPAKEVGGDFYDFYLIDKDHLALTIADVSGKCIPTALFMVISKTLLQNHAQAGGTPREILTYVNHQLCQNNTSFMFCTVWLGILDLRNGKLRAASAGHEYPVVKRGSGQFELFEDPHDPPLGLRDGIRYRDYELELAPGDCLFQYTDGVAEAENAAEEQFGTDRLAEALNRDVNAGPEKLIGNMYEALGGFVREAPQFDDITMLCLRYLGRPEAADDHIIRKECMVPAALENLDDLNDFVSRELEAVQCRREDRFRILLTVEEIFVNIAKYAYDGSRGNVALQFAFDEEKKLVELTFSDRGIPFDPTARKAPKLTADAEKRKEGGLGIHIVKETMDQVKYEYLGGKNVLTVRKKIET